MSEIVFTELRQFNSTVNRIDAIIKFNGLIFFSTNETAGGKIRTYNPITGRFLENSSFPAGDSINAFMVMPATTNANFIENTLYGVTGGTDGKLYIYDNDGTWTELADSGDSSATSLVFYKDNLYYGTNGDEVFKWDGAVQTISLTAAETSGDITALYVFDDLLFAGAIKVNDAEIFVFDNSSWALEDNLTAGGVNQVNFFIEFNGSLYASTPKSGGNSDLWIRDAASPPGWSGVTSTSQAGIEAMAVFMDKLYFATITDDSIQRYDGTNFDTIKTAVTGIRSYFSAFADGEDCVYFGSAADSNTVGLFAMCPRCSDQILISGASPFGWNVGDCDITPEICLIEDGCFCQILDTGDTPPIQIQFNGPGTPRLSVVNLDTGLEISNTAFVNIVGIVWRLDFDPLALSGLNIQLIVTTKILNEGEWLDKSVATSSDLVAAYVPSLTRVYIGGGLGPDTDILKNSSDLGDTFADQSLPATGADGPAFLDGIGAEDNVFVHRSSNGFGSSSDNLASYDIDNTPAAGTLGGAHAFDASDIIVINVNGGARITGDGGATWGNLANDPPVNAGDYSGIFMASANDIFLCDMDGLIHSTDDQGATAWVEDHDAGASNGLQDIFMISTTVGFSVGNLGTILKTVDGSTWTAQTSGTAEQLNSVWFANSLIGWAVGENSTILKTEDGGDTWAAQTAPNSANLNKVDGFISGSSIVVVAVGDDGAVFVLTSLTELGTDFASTECIEVKNDFDCGLLVKYTNDDNFADFNYENGLVNQIRLKAHFWRVENPTEKSIHVTSSEEVIPTRQVVKKQIMLETDIMPEYMHEKLSIIFSHAAIEIDGITYVAEEGYEHDPFPKNFRQAKGHVTLTDKTYTKENIF